MCLAIPGRIVQIGAESSVAVVEVSGVRRKVNVDLLKDEGLAPGDWVLIHVGFAMSRISERDAVLQLKMLAMLGEDAQAREEIEHYQFDEDR
jgi:hydrogenase expression/formation protein HypC